MVEYQRTLGFSMPITHAIYPAPPYQYPKMRCLTALFQIDSVLKKKFLPVEFEPMDMFDAIFLIEYPDSTIGPYFENIVLLSCYYKDKPGFFVSNIYVDSDIALTAGREIWGYPKKICKIELSQTKNNKISGSLTRMGVKFLEVESELTNRPPGLDIKGLVGNMPIFNLKLIPNVDGSNKPALRQVTETILGIGKIHVNIGCKTTFIKSAVSKYDLCDEYLRNAKKDLGGFYLSADMTLPPGKVLG